MWSSKRIAMLGTAMLWAVSGLAVSADEAPAGTAQSVEELRNTVVNILEAMVQKGLLTPDQAKQLVQQAKDRAAVTAAAEAAAKAQQAKQDEGAVRVPYVPQIVKDEISKQVAAEVKPEVVSSVVQQAKDEKWGVPGAMPEWLSHVRVTGDVTARFQANMYPADNSNDTLLDFNAINQAGGESTTAFPFMDTTHNRDYLRLRARLGVDVTMSPDWTAAIRLSTGSLTDPSSASQNEGTYGARYAVGVDQAYIRWNEAPAGKFSWATGTFGRQPDPWFSPTELVFARDLTFEGVSASGRLGWGDGADRSHFFLTAGAVPELEVPDIPTENKWLIGGQLGASLRFTESQHLKLALADYYFARVQGVQNVLGGPNENGTAPAFIRFGNTVFDISNGTNPAVNLFGLASQFRVGDVALSYEWNFGSHQLLVNGEFVRNYGYHLAQIEALQGQNPYNNATPTKPQNTGYVGEIGYGNATISNALDWRMRVGYRYVRADAVIDAWTDADFHGGGTNAQGYYIWGELGVAPNTWLKLRYMSANEVEGPKFGLDILQLDLNARF